MRASARRLAIPEGGATAAAARLPRVRTASTGWSIYQVALVGMIATFVWRVQQIIPPLSTLQLTSISTGTAILIFALSKLDKRHLPSASHPVFKVVLFILFWMLVSVPFGLIPSLSFLFLIEDHLKTFLFMVLLIAAIQTLRDVERFMMVQVIAATMYCIYALTSVEAGSDGRFPGLIYYDANDFAMLIVATLPFVVYFARPAATWRTKLVAAVAAAPFLLTLIKTGSRGGFIGLLVVCGYLLFSFTAVPKRTRINAVACCLTVLILFGGAQYWARMGTLLNPSEDYNWSGQSSDGRMEIWKRGVGYMLEKPITGVGPSAFYVAEGELSEMAALAELGIGFRWSAPHNSYVQIGAELGVVGLVAFLLLLTRTFTTSRAFSRVPTGSTEESQRRAALGQAFCASLLGFAVTSFFLTQAYAAFLYCTLAMVIGLTRIRPSTPAIVAVPEEVDRRQQIYSARRRRYLRPAAAGSLLPR